MADQLLPDMSDDEIYALLNKYNEDLNNGVLDPQSEVDLPTNDLINAVVGLRYLQNAGVLGKDEDFGDYNTLNKVLSQEITFRLGNLTKKSDSDKIEAEEA